MATPPEEGERPAKGSTNQHQPQDTGDQDCANPHGALLRAERHVRFIVAQKRPTSRGAR
jgi:hypothetical protein